jgi:hypothetical protein
MEEQIQLVRSHGSCEDPELTLVLLLRLSYLRGPRPWFTPEISAHWVATENFRDVIHVDDEEKHYMIRALGLLVDRGYLKAVVDLVDRHFILDAPTIKKIHLRDTYAAKLCISNENTRFDRDSIDELTDWVIENFDHRDPQIFIGLLFAPGGDNQSIAKILNHVPEVLKYLKPSELFTDSKQVVELAIFHGMAHKVYPECFMLEGLSASAIAFKPKYPPDDFPMDPAWLVKFHPENMRLEDYSPTFQADYRFYTRMLWETNQLVDSANIVELQKIFNDDRRLLVVAALCETYQPSTIPLETVKWFIASFDAGDLYLFAYLFTNCDSLEGSALLLKHAPLLLEYIKDWSLADVALTDLLIEYGAGHKLLPYSGKGDNYKQAVRMDDYLLTQGSFRASDEYLRLLLESSHFVTPHRLALYFRNKQDWPQLAEYLQSKTAEYRQEYEACCELLFVG